MSVIRIHKKSSHFVVLDKHCLNDVSLSWKAKGLHSYLMSLPDDWQVRVSDLVKRSKEGRDAVYGILKELMRAGYITREQQRDDDGSFASHDYSVHELPQTTTEPEPDTVNLSEAMSSDQYSTESPVRDPSTASGKAGSGGDISANSLRASPLPENPLAVNPTLLNNKNTEYPENPITNTTTGLSENPTASSHSFPSFASSPVAANEKNTVRCLTASLGVIGTQLTRAQRECVEKTAASLFAERGEIVGIRDARALTLSVEDCLLDRGSFTQAGNDFLKKLNTIKKCLRQGTWLPVPLKEATAPKALSAAEKNALELRALHDERERWHWLLTIASEQGKNASCLVQLQNHVKACERAIEALRRKMQTVSLSESSQNGVVSRDDSHAHALGTRPKNTMKIGREC